jgi:hypothetical protein
VTTLPAACRVRVEQVTERVGAYLRRMAAEQERFDPPSWASTWEHAADGSTVFRDESGEPLAALAVTRDELRQLEAGLRLVVSSDVTAALLDRLAGLHAKVDAAGR